MHSVSVCPSLSETMCACPFCMWLHYSDMLSCLDLPEAQLSHLSDDH